MLLQMGQTLRPETSTVQPPLMKACRRGHVEVIRLLVTKGADVNVRDEYGWTPLMRASRRGFLEVVEILISAARFGGQRSVWRHCTDNSGLGVPMEVANCLQKREPI